MKKYWLSCFFFLFGLTLTFGQCLNDYPGGAVNMSALTFTNGGSGCTPPTSAGTYTENVSIGNSSTAAKQMGNNDVLTMNFSFTLNGTLTVYANAHSTISIPAGDTVRINGDFIDANNNVTFDVAGALIISGSLVSNNNTVFSDGTSSGKTGYISVGTLNLGANAKCDPTTGCPTIYATTCLPSGSTFCTNNVLPVTLIFFKGASSANQVLLNWATATELNFDHFNLEKSANGKDFYTVTNIKGHGTTNIRQDYEAVDNNPVIGYNYYRLTSVDFDNYQETFDMIAVKYTGGKRLALSPNPFNGSDLSFNSNFDFSGAGTLNIFDSMGILVSSFAVPESNTTLHFSSPLKTGVYIAKFSSPSFSDVSRLVVK